MNPKSVDQALPVAPVLKATAPAPYLNPYIAGALLGVLLFVSVLISGHGIGASGGMARMLVALEDTFAPAHVDANPSLADMAGGRLNPLNNWVVFNVLGALLGGFVSGLLARRVRVETQKGPRISTRTRWLLAFSGGALVGFGARLARGCTSGQALSGGAVLSVGSWAFMFAVFAGGYLLAYPIRRLWN
jgi:uncharacterized protein